VNYNTVPKCHTSHLIWLLIFAILQYANCDRPNPKPYAATQFAFKEMKTVHTITTGPRPTMNIPHCLEYIWCMPIPMAVLSKAYVCGFSTAGICGFQSWWGRGYSSFVSVVCCVGSGLRDELITRPGESYRLFVCVCMCMCV